MSTPDDTTTEVCSACGSPNLRRRMYGLPSGDVIDELERDPDLELGGCTVSPTFWATKCKDCGHEVTLRETWPTFWDRSTDE